MHKYGYFYLDEGRNLTTKIARYINKSRYSNRKLQVEAPVIDPSFFFIFIFLKNHFQLFGMYLCHIDYLV